MNPIPWLLALHAGLGPAGYVEVADRPVDQMRSEWVHVEPHLAINPVAPEHWLAGVIVTDPEQRPDWHCAALASFDNGESWVRKDFDMDRCIDPWVVVLEDGSAIFIALEIQEGFEGDQRFVLQRSISSDGGRNWSGLQPLGRTFEHPIVVPGSTGLWMAARRTHEGEDGPRRVLHASFSDTRLQDIDIRSEFVPAGEAGDVMSTGLAVIDEGNLVISYTGDAPQYHASVVRSEDGGRSFSAPVPVTDRCGRGRGTFGGYPFMVGQGQTLFHACVGANYLGYWLAISPDGGVTWESARRVDGGGNGTQLRTPMLAAGDGGVLGMAWYDRRHDPERECQDVYFAGSTDGGTTISEPVRVTTTTSCPNAPGNGVAGGRSWNSGGDYSSLAALPDGRFALVWADSRSGRFQLRTAVLRVLEK